MTITQVALLLLSFLWLQAVSIPQPSGQAARKIRVACVGNSITYGWGMTNRQMNSYPVQLQALLGDAYEVRNFGKNGATVSHHGDIPYRQQPELRRALEFLPEIVFIGLGTNDSQSLNRIDSASFVRDSKTLIADFRALPTRPRVILLLPPPCFSTDATEIDGPYIRDALLPRLRQAAYESDTEVINLYNLFLDRETLFPDQVHPSSIGAGLIASRLFEAVKLEASSPPVIPGVDKKNSSRSNYYGFECTDFSFEGRNARIVRPRRTALGTPWILRARFWGHEPQTEIALLERGFHVAYCDLAELFGNDEAIGIWNRFYDLLTRGGFSDKPALEAFSRGGLYAYRWAAANPTRVACVYADAPVLDFKSWPGGMGRGHGNPEEWERFKRDFGLKTEEQAIGFRGNPVDLAPVIARAGFPLLHVCGDSDVTVPIEENTDIFESKILEAGGNITVIRKPGIGHHPHSFPNPQPIVDFVLGATGQKTTFAAIPVPGNEYREAAGWQTGMDWHAVAGEIDRVCDSLEHVDILFFGNSITQGIGGRGRSLAHTPGESAFTFWFRRYSWLNLGISGDRTQHVLWRAIHGTWARLQPKLIVLTVGVNNFPSDTGEEIVKGIEAILLEFRKQAPDAKILVAGPLPAKEPNSAFRKSFLTVHRFLKADGDTVLISTVPFMMLRPDGSLDESSFAADGVHLTPEGYSRWARMLSDEIERLRLLP